MRKLIYTIGAAACISLAACTGSSEYDAYVESLKAQTAAVDTIRRLFCSPTTILCRIPGEPRHRSSRIRRKRYQTQ